jgi:hypothetical protein
LRSLRPLSSPRSLLFLRAGYNIVMPGRSTTSSMDPTSIDRAASLRAYPTVSAAARMIGVAPSTLTRRDDCRPLSRGARDQVLPPVEVMRLAVEYRKRSLNEVAAALVSLATAEGDAERARVEAEIDGFFAPGSSEQSTSEFLAQAKRRLPSALYLDVERAVSTGQGRRPDAIIGNEPAKHGQAAKSHGGTKQKSSRRRVAPAGS